MTIVAPTGVENKTASRIPSTEVITEKMPAVMITFLKHRNYDDIVYNIVYSIS